MYFTHRTVLLFLLICLYTDTANGQSVPVREEPLHKPVLTNQYIRLLDVWLKPGDTSLYHIHEIPSVFCYLNNARYVALLEGESAWSIVEAVAGQSWYRSFNEGRLIHKVANPFDTALHVTDIELLSGWHQKNLDPLPFPVLFSSDKVFAYQISPVNMPLQEIMGRGPMVAEVVKGNVSYNDLKGCKARSLKDGDYQYIEPGKHFNFSAPATDSVKIVLFEIR